MSVIQKLFAEFRLKKTFVRFYKSKKEFQEIFSNFIDKEDLMGFSSQRHRPNDSMTTLIKHHCKNKIGSLLFFFNKMGKLQKLFRNEFFILFLLMFVIPKPSRILKHVYSSFLYHRSLNTN